MKRTAGRMLREGSKLFGRGLDAALSQLIHAFALFGCAQAGIDPESTLGAKGNHGDTSGDAMNRSGPSEKQRKPQI